MQAEILVIAEHHRSEIDPVTLDLMAWGERVAREKGWKLGVLVAGSGLEPVVKALGNSPADAVFKLEGPALESYNPSVYIDAIAGAFASVKPRLILAAHSYIGIELIGGLAAKLGATLWNNCLSIAGAAGGYKITRPVMGGSYVATLEIAEGACNMFSVQRGASPGRSATSKTPEVVSLQGPASSATVTVKVVEETNATFAEDITKADLVVAAGRGIGEPSGLEPLKELASALGGVIAASRPLVDLGWISVDHQVGLSGRTVRPKVYLAFGISGSAQHMAGMRDSSVIIAINNDPNAPIFQIAHYGIVADIANIVPELLEQAKAAA